MGVIHFMGVGKSVGVVTCVVDYVERALSLKNTNDNIKKFFAGSGGITHQEEDIGKIEALVLFSSQEVIRKELKSFPYDGCNDPTSVRDEIVTNLKKVWKHYPREGRKVYWCELDVDSFANCFDRILKVAFRFSQPKKVGKEIWCNLTGGTNSIGYSLLLMSQFTAISTKLYSISQRGEYQKWIQIPSDFVINPNKDDYLNVIPFLKTNIDTLEFFEVLMELLNLDRKITSSELLSRLKNRGLLASYDTQVFARKYLLKFYGLGYIEYNSDENTSQLTDSGIDFLSQLDLWEQSTSFVEYLKIDKTNIIEDSKKWDWFQEIDCL